MSTRPRNAYASLPRSKHKPSEHRKGALAALLTLCLMPEFLNLLERCSTQHAVASRAVNLLLLLLLRFYVRDRLHRIIKMKRGKTRELDLLKLVVRVPCVTARRELTVAIRHERDEQEPRAQAAEGCAAACGTRAATTSARSSGAKDERAATRLFSWGPPPKGHPVAQVPDRLRSPQRGRRGTGAGAADA